MEATQSISQEPYSVNNDLPEIAAPEVEGIVPEELLDNQWVAWRYEWRQNNRGQWMLTKVPLTTSGRHASHSNPATWEPWEKVLEYALENGGRVGVGRVLSAQDFYFILDIDNCRNPETGHIYGWAEPWVKVADAFGLYIEVSPSGTGLKIIGRGKLPGSGRRHVVRDDAGNKIGEFELYDQLRFTTITGDNISTVKTVGDGQDLIDKLLTDVFKPEKLVSEDWGEPNNLPDEEVIKRACKKDWFRKAWAGDYSRWNNDESRGDHAVASRLSFFTRNPAQTETLVRNNRNLYRPKWDTNRTYLQRTIQNSKPDDFYDPTRSQNSNNGTTSSPPIIIGKHLPSYSVDELNESAREETPWVIEGIAAKGAVTDFYGPAKHGGKTTFITHACASIVDGLPFVGREVNQERVLYLTEMAQDNFKDYLQHASIRKGDDFRTVFKRDVWDMKWDELIASAGQMCADQGRGVLVVDTFAEFSGIRGTEENNAGDVHEKLSALRKVAQQHDLAVILIRHANKEGKGRGSSAFEASVDIVIGYKRPDKASSESCARVIDAVGRWTESNFTTNVELTPDGFTEIGDEKHVQFNKAVRAIMDAAPLGRDRALKRDGFKVESVSQATIDNALTWLVEKGELVTTGAGKKGDPRRFYIPKILSNNDPGPYSAPLLETEEEEDAGSEVLFDDPWLWEEVYDPRTGMTVPHLLLEDFEIPEPVGPDPEPQPWAVPLDRTITIDLTEPDDDPIEVRVWEPIKEEGTNAASAYKAIREIRNDWQGYKLPTDAQWWVGNLEANGTPFTLEAVEMALAA